MTPHAKRVLDVQLEVLMLVAGGFEVILQGVKGLVPVHVHREPVGELVLLKLEQVHVHVCCLLFGSPAPFLWSGRLAARAAISVTLLARAATGLFARTGV